MPTTRTLPAPSSCPAPDAEHDFNLFRFGACPDCTAKGTPDDALAYGACGPCNACNAEPCEPCRWDCTARPDDAL